MAHIDLSLPDPADPNNLDPADRVLSAPSSPLRAHPYVRRLQRELDALRKANDALRDLQREMMNRDLIAARNLEPLNPIPAGTVLTPAPGQPILLHVDNLRLLVNRVTGAHDPVIRLLNGGVTATPQHCRELRLLGPSALVEHALALPHRPAALVVLETYAPVEVVR
jgi:hypothetical protein